MNKVMIIAFALLAAFSSNTQAQSATVMQQAKNFAKNQCETNVLPALKTAVTCANIQTLMQKAGFDAKNCFSQAQATLKLSMVEAGILCAVVQQKFTSFCEGLPAMLEAKLPNLCDQI